MKNKKIVIASIIIIVLLFAVFGAKEYIEANLEGLAEQSITNIDISMIKDGTYEGSHRAFPVAAEVKVVVASGKITAIELVKHNNGQGTDAEIISDKVIETQSLAVDVVSGATYSSKVILKAIENALIGVNQ